MTDPTGGMGTGSAWNNSNQRNAGGAGNAGNADDSPTLPNVYAGGSAVPPPAGFWDELRAPAPPPGEGSATEFAPPYQGAAAGIVIPSSAPDRDARRRGALLAISGVVLATVVVVLATLIIGPHLRPTSSGPTNNVDPPASPTGSAASEADPTTESSLSPDSGSAGTSGSVGMSGSLGGSGSSTNGNGQTVTSGPTTTATASPTTTPKAAPVGVSTATVGGTRSGTGATRTSTSTSRSVPPVVVSTVGQSPPPVQTTTVGSQPDFGVPLRQIQCSAGVIVQLASELTPQAFRARVSTLSSQGLVPGDAAAATTAGSCAIFTGQQNTYVLYSGPFGSLSQACNDRLSGPYDAYVKGGNPGSAGSFYSCICPARPRELPTIDRIGQTSQWIGELQRMLAAHLRYGVGGLGNAGWGVYTSGTQAAVKRFQSDHHLKPDGVVNAKTWAALKSAGC